MLYLNSIENAEASPTQKKYAICHEEVPSMLHIPELAPSRGLLAKWQSNTIDWEEFRERFTDEMRVKYRKEENRLKGLIKYSLENDVTLHSPEPGGEQTYRAILEGIINAILADKGQTDRVINLARKPVEESQPQEDIANLFGDALHELNLTKADNTRLLIENAELKKDIQFFQTEGANTGKENDELKKQIDQLEEQINTHEATIDDLRRTLSEKQEIISNQKNEIQSLQQQIDNPETTIGDLRRTLSEKDGEIQSLNNAIGERDSENDRLNRTSGQLQEQINTHETTIGDLRRTLSEKDGEIQSLNDAIGERDKKTDKLKTQIVQFQDINTHPRIRDIAIKATEDDSKFREHFKTLPIDENYPEILIETLRNWLKNCLKTGPKDLRDLPELIKEYKDCDKFDQSDSDLAHVIRTQRNLTAFGKEEIDERTIMGRALCCFFAAALLVPKLSKSDQTSTAPKNTHQKQQHPPQSDYASTKSSKSIKPKSEDAEAHYKRGIDYQKKGDYDRAIAEYTKAIKLNPDYTSAYYNRATAYYYKSNYVGVIADLTKVIEQGTDNANVYYDRAIAYYRKGYYVRAIADLTKVIELKPGNVNAYYHRGDAYEQQGDHARARADFAKAKQLKK